MTYRKLQELPSQSLPREKLLRQGRHSLSNAELLAIFLRMGIKGKNVLDMSSDLIQSAGSLDALAHMEAAEIANICKGIGMAKAATLSAAFELGARALRETLSRQPIQTPEDVYDYLTTAGTRSAAGYQVPPHQTRGNIQRDLERIHCSST